MDSDGLSLQQQIHKFMMHFVLYKLYNAVYIIKLGFVGSIASLRLRIMRCFLEREKEREGMEWNISSPRVFQNESECAGLNPIKMKKASTFKS